MKLTISSRHLPRPLKVTLSLHLEGNTNLVATRINIAAVDEGGESDCDAVPQLCWYPSPTSLLLLILARTAAPSGRTYLAPIPKVVAAEAELHPRETPVSRAGDTFW